MALTLFRRHGLRCEAGRPQDSYTSEVEERRKGWVKCTCKIHAHGSLGSVFSKLGTKCREWELAKIVIAPYVAADSWDIDPDPPPAPPAPVADSGHGKAESGQRQKPDPKIPDAIKAFLEHHKTSGSAEGTVSVYGYTLGELETFAGEKGITFLGEWAKVDTSALVARWQGERGNLPGTVDGKLGTVKTFFGWWVNLEVIPSNPAQIKLIKNALTRSLESRQRIPFSDEEIGRMLEACDRRDARKGARKVVAIRPPKGGGAGRYTGQDLADFINLAVYSGLRISDLAAFDITKNLLASGEVFFEEVKKNRKQVNVWIPEWLQARLRLRAAQFGPQIFGPYATADINSMTSTWRKRLETLWKDCGPFKKKPTAHRFRHTFIRILLQEHTPIEAVAEAAGDTVEVIRKYYSAWVPGRQEALNARVKKAFGERDRFRRHA